MIEAPIFHVNGDDPEAVVFVAELATEFRQSSAATWSSTSSAIAATATTRATSRPSPSRSCTARSSEHEDHAHALHRDSWPPRAACRPRRSKAMLDDVQRQRLEAAHQAAQASSRTRRTGWKAMVRPAGGRRRRRDPSRTTGGAARDAARDRRGAGHGCPTASTSTRRSPASSKPSGRSRAARASTGRPARRWRFGSLLLEGHRVRLSGEDMQRGTFSQRQPCWSTRPTSANTCR